MSNSRIFCVAFSVFDFLLWLIKYFGFARYSGSEAVIVEFSIATSTAILVVALFGDRKAKP